TPISTFAPTPTPTPKSTPASTTTMQLSESKRNELIGYVEQYSGSKEVTVAFIPSENGGTFLVDFTLDSVPNSEDLNNDIADIIIASKAVAQESGIQNPDVSVCAKLESGRGLGLGSYYSSTDKTDIDVSDCHS
ncbi:MAG: hypothetical protein P4M12_10565, partial [Gammaproteobacteria bacterium]|nr:hypothetical protein [Gammaproteobacteria bacterium]